MSCATKFMYSRRTYNVAASPLPFRFLSLRHQHGGDLALVENGQVLNPSETHVRLQGQRGHLKIRLPLSFYVGIRTETQGKDTSIGRVPPRVS